MQALVIELEICLVEVRQVSRKISVSVEVTGFIVFTGVTIFPGPMSAESDLRSVSSAHA